MSLDLTRNEILYLLCAISIADSESHNIYLSPHRSSLLKKVENYVADNYNYHLNFFKDPDESNVVKFDSDLFGLLPEEAQKRLHYIELSDEMEKNHQLPLYVCVNRIIWNIEHDFYNKYCHRLVTTDQMESFKEAKLDEIKRAFATSPEILDLIDLKIEIVNRHSRPHVTILKTTVTEDMLRTIAINKDHFNNFFKPSLF